jgi:hypothetical protein
MMDLLGQAVVTFLELLQELVFQAAVHQEQ